MIRTIKIILVCFCLLGTTSIHAQLYKQKTELNTKIQTESKQSGVEATKSSKKGIFAPSDRPTLKSMGGDGGGFDEGGDTDLDDGFNDSPAGDIAWLFLAGLGLAYGIIRKKQNTNQTAI